MHLNSSENVLHLAQLNNLQEHENHLKQPKIAHNYLNKDTTLNS